MLVPVEEIMPCLEGGYGLYAPEIARLPLGADLGTAVYRVATGGQRYFLKLRAGKFDPASAALPDFLHRQGVGEVIPIVPTRSGQLWSRVGEFTTILYPYIDGQDGYGITLMPAQWRELGSVVRQLHALEYPMELREESYPSDTREKLKRLVGTRVPFLRDEQAVIVDMIKRAERLAEVLCKNPPPCVVCHTDLHAGNLHITATGELFIVDWDQPLLAPKERDLMYVGGALMASGLTPQEEEELFYAGYGLTSIDWTALAYYRYERIIQDIWEYSEMLLSDDVGGDRAQSLAYLEANFLPNGTIDLAYQAEQRSQRRS